METRHDWIALAVFVACSCSKHKQERVKVDGSSTVFLMSMAAAEEYSRLDLGYVTVGSSGTGGGFKKFCSGEVDLIGASRPVSPEEIDACGRGGVDFIELPIAYDGLVVVVNRANDWASALTVAELRAVWEPSAEGRVTRWSDVRPGFPDRPLRLFGPGSDSGTFEYFTEAVVQKKGASRSDYTRSETDNALVQGVMMDDDALGYFGFAYFTANRGELRALAIDDGRADNGAGPIAPSVESITNHQYQPMSRPLFLYVAADAAERPEVDRFVSFFLERSGELALAVGYVALPPAVVDLVEERWVRRRVGSAFHGREAVGVDVGRVLEAEVDGG
jgi:phosphate transport system substrate-binding protein